MSLKFFMPTSKKRTNLVLSSELDTALTHLAKRDNVPKATKATELLKIAIKIEEDEVWDKLAQERDNEDSNFVTHKKAWS